MQKLAAFGGCGDDAGAFGDRPGHGLFDVNVLTGGEGVEGDAFVQVVWCRDDDGFDVFVVEERTIVLGGLDFVAKLLLATLEATVI